MKNICLSLYSAFFLHLVLFSQNIVINEVFYDPTGSDGGYEWIELYNAGDEAINMFGWKIQKAGAEFESAYLFELLAPTIHPGEYLLIGEEFVPDADITADLGFQNGGSSTDGIRLVSSDDFYTDTILYDEPNSNNLPDDISTPGNFFAPDVSSGHSLARKHNGIDSNNCTEDWFECENPTPGEANFYPIDLAIQDAEISEIDDIFILNLSISNLSTEDVDNFTASLEITLNDTLFGSYNLPIIPASASINYSIELGEFSNGLQSVLAELNFQYDSNLENNSATVSFLVGSSPLVLNEILFKPAENNQEWLEIFNRSACGYCVDNFKIIDASGGEIRISGNIAALDFVVVCSDSTLLKDKYPQIDSDKIIQANSWTSLNNTSETLLLTDNCGTVLDSVCYEGGNCPTDFSLERKNPFSDENIIWEICQNSVGGTPAFPNSVLPFEKDLQITASAIQSQENTLLHSVSLKNVGLNPISFASLKCFSSLNDNETETEIFSTDFELFDSLLFEFQTDFPSAGYTTFHYEIFSPEDLNIENNSAFSFYNNNSLPFVVNEIMYNPSENEPEWLEIKINKFIPHLTLFYVFTNNDSVIVENTNSEYILLVHSEEDTEFLQENYDLSETPIVTGLASLSNGGEQIILKDECGNIIEDFSYLPEWNDSKKDVSIERVNPNLPSNNNNWGPAVAGSTPGKENSIFVQYLPKNIKLAVAPNPFSPFKSERTIISFSLPEALSTATIRIFDLKGRLINKLINQELEASGGEIIWDGTNKNGKKLPVGIYIILMDAVSRETEKVYQAKTTVVVGK